MRAIMEAANQVNAPVIVQASAGARKYAGAPFLRHLICSSGRISAYSRCDAPRPWRIA